MVARRKSIAFIEGLMSNEGAHGGDLLTISLSSSPSAAPVNRTPGRKSSVTSLFWSAPDHILVTEIVGGETVLSQLTVGDNSLRTLWKGAEGLHAFGNFPNLAVSPDGKFAAAVRDTYETPPEVWAGPLGQWRQLTKNNAAQAATGGKAESLAWTNEGFNIQGWLIPPLKVESGKNIP